MDDYICQMNLVWRARFSIIVVLILLPFMTLSLTARCTACVPVDLLKQVGSPTLARVLYGRGVSDVGELEVDISGLLPASGLLGIDEAVAVIDKAVDANQKILIVGDFDCDGATSTALMVRCLRQMGAIVDYIVPDRFKFGYGLTPELVEYAHALYTPHLIVTVDNGISSHLGVQTAHQLGIQVVITDHHLTCEPAPPACAVVNPNQLDCSFGSKSLVGVGVAFYVMGSLAKVRREAGKPSVQVSQYLDLVAVGTIADMGVLDKNNRILVSHGLERIRQGRAVAGIIALLDKSGKNIDKLVATDIGFSLAPRINAAGRMDNMQIGVECLLTDDMYTAHTLAFHLNSLNSERRQVQDSMKKVADEMLSTLDSKAVNQTKKAVILYDDNWHQGVIGIVAGRIKDTLYLPTLIFAPADKDKIEDNDYIKASARSIAGVHIRDVLVEVNERYPDLICHFGGHAMAAGLTLYKKDYERFCVAFWEVIGEYDESVFSETKLTDGELLPSDMTLKFAKILKTLSVWGQGFVYPTFDGEFQVMSAKILKDKHLKLMLTLPDVEYPIHAIWFNYDSQKWNYRASKVHILYSLDINEWQGNQNVQCVIHDLSVCQIQTLSA